MLFDLLNGQYINLSNISNRQILRIRDGIRPLYEPRFERMEEVKWLTPSDRVIVLLGESRAAVYPLKILEYHEIVNDTFDGRPILITYCPLCASGVVFDRETGSVWAVIGEGVSGPLQGRQLRPLPSRIAQWFSIVRTIPDIEGYTP